MISHRDQFLSYYMRVEWQQGNAFTLCQANVIILTVLVG
ncbi:MAG: hypothetical protein ANABAC_1367 [Anaerolineae bacterium]|nr:MAG: hypothetical protein ANABAC_1367 [Anaerolineae bacterium]